MANTTVSTVFTRSTASTPLKVAYAANPMTKKTVSALRLPPPIRTSVLLPQPEASTIPTPNSTPPDRADSQITRPGA